MISRDFVLRPGSVGLGALRRYQATLAREGLIGADQIRLTGRWVVQSGLWGGVDPAYLFEIVHGEELAWINELGLFIGYKIADYFGGAK